MTPLGHAPRTAAKMAGVELSGAATTLTMLLLGNEMPNGTYNRDVVVLAGVEGRDDAGPLTG